MKPTFLACPLLLLLAPAAAQQRPPSASATPPAARGGVIRTEVRIRRVIVRVPRAGGVAPVSQMRILPPVQWVEKRADRCFPIDSLAAMSMTRTNSVDLMLAGGKRIRAQLGDNCPALAFYSGFYLKPARDGKICASRDAIRTRSGEQCRIRAFRTLVPAH